MFSINSSQQMLSTPSAPTPLLAPESQFETCYCYPIWPLLENKMPQLKIRRYAQILCLLFVRRAQFCSRQPRELIFGIQPYFSPTQ